MKRQTLFVSDLHLSAARPDAVGCFLDFLGKRALGAAALYILGDLFDAYIGDDDDRFPNREIKLALRHLSDRGTRIYFQHGNRDFLLGEGFSLKAGVELLDDYAVIDLYGTLTLLTHGDLLCSDDLQYQAARQRIRTAAWKRRALAKPLLARKLYARWYRFKSGWDKSGKTAEIMDVNPAAVGETMERYGISRLIHGHTHRPAVHDLVVRGRPAQRFVLAEWTDRGQVLAWHSKGYQIEAIG